MIPFTLLLRQNTLRLAAGLSVISAASTCLAQPRPIITSDIAWPGLTRDDVDRMHAAAARLYEGRSIGTVERWRSPDSKDAGEVKLVHSFNAKGMPCRTLDYTIQFNTARNHPNHYVINWCKVEGGEWKIVEVAPPR